MTPELPERLASLVVSLVPLIAAGLGVLYFFVNRHDEKAKDKKAAENPTPAVGVTVDDDHADAAIEALTESRDAWKSRALKAESRVLDLEHHIDNLANHKDTT